MDQEYQRGQYLFDMRLDKCSDFAKLFGHVDGR